MKRSILLFCLVFLYFYQTDGLFADPKPYRMPASGLSRDINIALGEARWRAAGALIRTRASSNRAVSDLLAGEDIESVERYAEWLRRNIRYRRDKMADIWHSPEATLARGYGDCEDFAILNGEALRVLGYRPQVVAFLKRGKRKWHAICAFKEEGRYHYLDNSRLIKTSAASLKQFAGHLNAESDIIILKP